jgi:hypothetical protein
MAETYRLIKTTPNQTVLDYNPGDRIAYVELNPLRDYTLTLPGSRVENQPVWIVKQPNANTSSNVVTIVSSDPDDLIGGATSYKIGREDDSVILISDRNGNYENINPTGNLSANGSDDDVIKAFNKPFPSGGDLLTVYTSTPERVTI